MKYFNSRLFAITFFICSGCTSVSLVQSDRQYTMYDLNKASSLVGDTSTTVHGEQNVLYSVSNDNDNLYVTLMIADRKTQSKILRNGFTLWVDTTGAKKEKQGILYPLSSKDKKDPSEPGKQRHSSDQDDNISYQDKTAQVEAKRRLLLTMTDMDLIGFRSGPPVRVPAISTSGSVSISLMLDSNGTLQYHAVIPFSVMHYHPALHTGKKSKPITIACTTARPENAGGNHGNSGDHGGGMSGGGGGMSGGGMGGGGMHGGGGHGGGGKGGSQYSVEEEPLDIWMHVKLAGF